MKRFILTLGFLALGFLFASDAKAATVESSAIKLRLDAVSIYSGGAHRVYTSLASNHQDSNGGINSGCSRSLFVEFDDKQLFAAVLDAAASQKTVYVYYVDGLASTNTSPYGSSTCQLIGIKLR